MKPADLHSITLAQGFYAAGGPCGIKASGKADLALIVSDRPCAAAGVFTRSRTPAAPIAVNKRHLRSRRARAIVVNSGNANASTGKAGRADAATMCRQVARALSHATKGLVGGTPISPDDVLVASTGIIGRPLPMDKIKSGIDALTHQLGRGTDADAAAARAIMTTDLAPKATYREVEVERRVTRLGGIAKGSGMIAPNMGTMLAFVTTDAAVTPQALRSAVRQATDASFNRISIDQHTSPSDMVLVLANGAAGNATISETGPALDAFVQALTDLCRDLAYRIVKDGEGATKVFRARVTGARNEKEADRVAKTVIDSPLVKTAVHGGDPNWGRIITAAGYSGAAVQAAKMSLTIGKSIGHRPESRVRGPESPVAETGIDEGVCVFAKGMPTTLNGEQTQRLDAIMKDADITFALELGRGDATVEWLGCDLSREYITINADYTT